MPRNSSSALTAAFDADKKLTGMRMRISGQSVFVVARPEMVKNGLDPAVFQGFAASGDARIAYDFANLLVDHSMRKSAGAAGMVARREHQSERNLSRMFHG